MQRPTLRKHQLLDLGTPCLVLDGSPFGLRLDMQKCWKRTFGAKTKPQGDGQSEQPNPLYEVLFLHALAELGYHFVNEVETETQ